MPGDSKGVLCDIDGSAHRGANVFSDSKCSALSKVFRKGENVLGGSVISSLNMILTHGPLRRLGVLLYADTFTASAEGGG